MQQKMQQLVEMKDRQQQINTIIKHYFASGTSDAEHEKWGDIASYVYANVLMDENISALELRSSFKHLRMIAESADFSENTAAIGHAIGQPLINGAKAVQNGGMLMEAVVAGSQLLHDPMHVVKGAHHALQNAAHALSNLAQDETNFLTMQRRHELASIYVLPHRQRIEALAQLHLDNALALSSLTVGPKVMPKAPAIANAAGQIGADITTRLDPLTATVPYNEPILEAAGANSSARIASLPSVDDIPSTMAARENQPESAVSAMPDSGLALQNAPIDLKQGRKELAEMIQTIQRLEAQLNTLLKEDGASEWEPRLNEKAALKRDLEKALNNAYSIADIQHIQITAAEEYNRAWQPQHQHLAVKTEEEIAVANALKEFRESWRKYPEIGYDELNDTSTPPALRQAWGDFCTARETALRGADSKRALFFASPHLSSLTHEVNSPDQLKISPEQLYACDDTAIGNCTRIAEVLTNSLLGRPCGVVAGELPKYETKTNVAYQPNLLKNLSTDDVLKQMEQWGDGALAWFYSKDHVSVIVNDAGTIRCIEGQAGLTCADPRSYSPDFTGGFELLRRDQILQHEWWLDGAILPKPAVNQDEPSTSEQPGGQDTSPQR